MPWMLQSITCRHWVCAVMWYFSGVNWESGTGTDTGTGQRCALLCLLYGLCNL